MRLTKTDVNEIVNEGQLNSIQQIILEEYLRDTLTDEGIRLKHSIPERLFHRNKEALFFKVEKLAAAGRINL
jgi:hypothetical protein